jgi:hypothetical protein
MSSPKLLVPSSNDTSYRKQLEYLYARRTTVKALIESLQNYDRFRAQGGNQDRKMA